MTRVRIPVGAFGDNLKNRNVGLLLIVLGGVISLIIYMFNKVLVEIVSSSCSHGPTCPMWGSIVLQTRISTILALVIFALGIYFFLEEIITKKLANKKRKKSKKKTNKSTTKRINSKLTSEEKKIFDEISKNDGASFQSQIVEGTGFNKSKVTRILDRLEGRGIIERRRRGMTNLVLLKKK